MTRSFRARRSIPPSFRARRSMGRSFRARRSIARSFRARRSIRAQLQGASLYSAQLQGASLYRAQLQGASLDDAQLQGAWLKAQLQGASLGGRNFRARRLRRPAWKRPTCLTLVFGGSIFRRRSQRSRLSECPAATTLGCRSGTISMESHSRGTTKLTRTCARR